MLTFPSLCLVISTTYMTCTNISRKKLKRESCLFLEVLSRPRIACQSILSCSFLHLAANSIILSLAMVLLTFLTWGSRWAYVQGRPLDAVLVHWILLGEMPEQRPLGGLWAPEKVCHPLPVHRIDLWTAGSFIALAFAVPHTDSEMRVGDTTPMTNFFCPHLEMIQVAKSSSMLLWCSIGQHN